MRFFGLLVLCFATLGQPLFAQEEVSEASEAVEEKEWTIRPEITAGVGMLVYRGDLFEGRKSLNLFQNKLAFHIGASQPVTDFLDVNFFMLYGSLGANERTLLPERNLNFESTITSAGFALSYNFFHVLKPGHRLEPFVSVGFEAFQFVSKTDLIDGFGNRYHYWSDGTIRNQPETTENLTTAIEITRDYEYETDIRELNADGFGNYSERSFAIPISIGYKLLLNDKVNFKMGIEYHWTFTDYIDGITDESRGLRAGNERSDRFYHTFIGLSYNLTQIPKNIDPDFSGDDRGDSDQDSIPDFLDDCPATPLGVQVDSKGCPLDSDNDGVVDYKDLELNSPEGAIVDSSGVALSDQDFEQLYLEYTDETGEYTEYTATSYALDSQERKTKRKKTSYTVKIGEFEEGVNDSLANILLSMPDVTTRQTEDGKTIIEVGNFESLPDALKRKVELESSGIATQDLIETNTSGEESRVTNIEQDMVSQETFGMPVNQVIQKNKSLPPPKRLITSQSEYTLDRPIDERSVSKADDSQYGNQTVYRVQIGAFANKLKRDVFGDIQDLLVVTTQDGLTRYYTGSFTSYQQAASRKIDIIGSGFPDAYVVPFKNGQRVSLQSTGQATPAQNVVPRNSSSSPTDSPNYGKVKFKVQIGSYASDIPTDVLDRMMDLGKVDQRQGSDGATKYFVGEFNTYEEANAFKQELAGRGFDGAFVAGEYNGNIISANEAIQLLQ